MDNHSYNFPISFMEFDHIDYDKYPCYDDKKYGRGKNENAIAIFLEENGWKFRHFENEIVWHLFGYIAYEKLLIIPDWNKWDPQRTINEYPQLYQHLSKREKEWIEKLRVRLGWSFSEECLKLNGQPALLGVGIPYQMCKTEIDKFLYEELPQENIMRLMNHNYEQLRKAREKYPTLFNWASYYHPVAMRGLIKRMPIQTLQYILHKMFLNFHYYRTGFPDFWAWHPEKDNIKLIEVKGIREKIGDEQVWWLEELNKLGIDSSVIRVKWKRATKNRG